MGTHGPAAGGGAAGWDSGVRRRAQNIRPSRSGRGGTLRRSTVVVRTGHGREFSDPKRRAVAREVRPQSPKLKGQQNLKTAAAKMRFFATGDAGRGPPPPASFREAGGGNRRQDPSHIRLALL